MAVEKKNPLANVGENSNNTLSRQVFIIPSVLFEEGVNC